MISREEFESDIKGLLSIPNDNTSYEGRVGPPDELTSVIGRISMNFSFLEETLSDAITKLLNLDNKTGNIITAELSFKNKVNLFATLYITLKDTYKFNVYPGFEKEHFNEIIKALNKCEELRNQVIHSRFSFIEHDKQRIIRTKTTAKQKLGFKVINEETNVPKLFNIADFIIGVAEGLDEFLLN